MATGERTNTKLPNMRHQMLTYLFETRLQAQRCVPSVSCVLTGTYDHHFSGPRDPIRYRKAAQVISEDWAAAHIDYERPQMRGTPGELRRFQFKPLNIGISANPYLYTICSESRALLFIHKFIEDPDEEIIIAASTFLGGPAFNGSDETTYTLIRSEDDHPGAKRLRRLHSSEGICYPAPALKVIMARDVRVQVAVRPSVLASEHWSTHGVYALEMRKNRWPMYATTGILPFVNVMRTQPWKDEAKEARKLTKRKRMQAVVAVEAMSDKIFGDRGRPLVTMPASVFLHRAEKTRTRTKGARR